MIHDRRLDLGLADRPAAADPVGDQAEGQVERRRRELLGLAVHRHCSSSQVASNCWIRSPDETTSTPVDADQLDDAGVDLRHVGIGDARGVFHRDPAAALDHRGHAGFELLPGEVDRLLAGQVVERGGLDPMDQLPGGAPCGDEVEEPPRARRLLVEAEHPTGQHVAAPEVVEQPAVEAELGQTLLDRGEVEHGRSLPQGDDIATPAAAGGAAVLLARHVSRNRPNSPDPWPRVRGPKFRTPDRGCRHPRRGGGAELPLGPTTDRYRSAIALGLAGHRHEEHRREVLAPVAGLRPGDPHQLSVLPPDRRDQPSSDLELLEEGPGDLDRAGPRSGGSRRTAARSGQP